MSHPPVVILGPTASGKSDVAMHVAQQLSGTEIVAVDAMMVYRGMDIGTGKPTPDDQRLVRHHCLDIADPGDRFTVAEFQKAARGAMQDIGSRGGRALLVAGTGMYLQVLINEFTLPGEFPEVREALEQRDVAEIFAELKERDPEAAAKMESTNKRRIVRALEVCIGSGRKFSSFGPGADTYPKSDIKQIGILWPREELAARIERRVHAMFNAGWVDEVRSLMNSPMSDTARQALGYKEIIDHIHGKMSLDEAIAQTVLHTRQFAVRQERWFRRDPRIEWVQIDPSLNPVEQVAPKVLNCLGKI